MAYNELSSLVIFDIYIFHYANIISTLNSVKII